MHQLKRPARKQRLTEPAVRKARPEATAYLIWDSHQRGLALRVQPTGSKAWVVIYSRHGRPRWLHLGAADVIPLADARKHDRAWFFPCAALTFFEWPEREPLMTNAGRNFIILPEPHKSARPDGLEVGRTTRPHTAARTTGQA
jgi:hypothetical protein